MKKNNASFFAILFFALIIGLMYFFMMPQWVSSPDSPKEFSVKKALNHIKIISKKPHYVGSENHKIVANYIFSELTKLGLDPKYQEGTTLTDWGNLVQSKNIVARINGTNSGKALLLLSHYDSAPHSFSRGASDDASGVATILEGIRAFIEEKKPHSNDIIILFSDAEELGLNGAALFVTRHQWAKDVGLVINFEARGTAGPSYMLMEVNKGNAALVNGFTKANPKYPVSNSLMYSIYKMLPNDTDLTIFRELGKTQGLNFAFIDNHFNYHTQQDSYAHVSPTTIAHQGSYLMPLLHYFSNADLQLLESGEDKVYFNIPFYFFSYPFSWIMNMCVVAALLFSFLLVLGLGKKLLNGKEILKGFFILLFALLVSVLFSYFGWKLLLKIYPDYGEILQGFTYNGHFYITAFVLLSLVVCFLFYGKSKSETVIINQTISPIFLWIVLNFGIAIYLPGAAFFIIPVFFSLLMLAYFIISQKTSLYFNLLFSIPALLLFVPFIIQLPIGLGLKMLFGSAALTVLVFALLLPVFGSFTNKRTVSLFLFIIVILVLVIAHFNSDFTKGKAKPNSLVYLLDTDKNIAVWATYDLSLDEWNRFYLEKNSVNLKSVFTNQLYSKYQSTFTFASKAPIKKIPKSTISFVKDSTVGAWRFLKIKISPTRKINRYDLFANKNSPIYNFKANGVKALDQKGTLFIRTDNRLLSYYVVDNAPLLLEFTIPSKTVLNMDIWECSFDLLSNPLFQLNKRTSWMMPKPFVLTDAIIIRQKIKPSVEIKPFITTVIPLEVKKDSVTQSNDSVVKS